MPRLGYEPPCQPVRRPPSERDRFLFVIKFAAFVVAIGLFGGFYLLSGGSSREAGRPAAAVTVSSTPSSAPVVVAPPVQSTVTSQVVPSPAEPSPEPPPASTPAPPPEPTPAPAPDRRFAVVGDTCPRPGMYSFTSRYQPVVCQRGAWAPVELDN